MLKFFSRLERTRNFVLLLFAILMVTSLVLFYAPTRDTTRANLSGSNETLAKVGSEQITVGEMVTQKENASRMFGGRGIPTKYLMDSVISQRITRIEANRLGLVATDAEVAGMIRKFYKSPDGKPFDQARYEENAIQEAGSVAAYEKNIRDSIADRKLRAYITGGVSVTEHEVLDDFRRRNTKYDLNVVAVTASELTKTINPSDEELKAYFEKNKANYYIGLPQKKIRYVFINTAKIGEKLVIPEADLRAQFDKLADDKKIAGVNGQQIVLRIPKPEAESQILSKANELIQQANKDGGVISEEAFAALAKGRSEDPVSAQQGGKLRGLVRSNPNLKDDPYQRLFAMKEGQVSEPIKYGANYYILRRGTSVPKSFEEAKKELDVSMRNQRAYDAASALAKKIVDRLKETKDVPATAAQFAAEANMNVKDMVRETAYLKKDDDVPNIGVSPQFEEGISMLENPNDVGDRTPIKDGFAIPLLVDKKEPRDAEFAEVKDKVLDAVKSEQATARVEQIAKDIAAGASNAAGIPSAAQSKGLKSEDIKDFILGSPLGNSASAGTSKTLEDAIAGLKNGETAKDPIKVGDSWYVVGLTNKQEASTDDFTKQRDQLFDSMLDSKRNRVFQEYLADIRRRMEAAGEIKIYKDVMAKLDEQDKESEGDTDN